MSDARDLLMTALASLPGFVSLGPNTWEFRPRRAERQGGWTEAADRARGQAIERAEAKRRRRAARLAKEWARMGREP